MIFSFYVCTQVQHYARILCMKHFRKRTIALVLASVVTVAGSFAAGNYRNTLMNFNFVRGDSGEINMVLQTKNAYEGIMNPVRRDANTYVLMLPETNSLAPTPDLKSIGGIDYVDVNTLPYTNHGKGYTKITIHTGPNTKLVAKNEIYIPANNPQLLPQSSEVNEPPKREYSQNNKIKDQQRVREDRISQDDSRVKSDDSSKPEESVNNQPSQKDDVAPQQDAIPQTSAPVTSASPVTERDSTEAFLLVLAIFVILAVTIFLYLRAKDKLTEIAGEQIKIDVDDAPKKTEDKKKKVTKIKNTIKRLDAKYPKPSAKISTNEYLNSAVTAPVKVQTEEENVVDLDELLQAKTNASSDMDEDENAALDDFLSGFSFDDSVEEVLPEEEGPLYDEELYNKTINDNTLVFTKDDAEKINKLLNTEINDATLKNISEFAVSNPIKKEPSKQERLENFVTSYAISQNITFTKEDVSALYKLMNVEIDKDFLTDLKTNPERAKEMAQEISRKKVKPHKSSEILTLSVKDMLPDLSEALRKQGDRRIESEVKPTTVYYSEGYDVSTLSLKDQLPDLSVEINNKDSYVSKPSAKIELAESGYEVEKLNISNQLPDLKDVVAHPEKYAEPEREEVKVDEDALLKNISNVQFKPFYDGSEEFEVRNDFDDENAPSVSDIQKEFSQFGNFEISEEEVVDNASINDDYDDFEALYSNEFVDLDKNKEVTPEPVVPQELQKQQKPQEPQKTQKVEKPEEFVPAKLERSVEHFARSRDNKSEDLVRKIEQTRIEREERKARISAQKAVQKKQEDKIEVTPCVSKCILDGKSYTVISTTNFAPDKGCYLVKNDTGYAVIGFVGDKLIELKQYQILKSEKIQSRMSEKLADGTLRYIVRIGLQKFIVDVVDDDIKYVMDLC